MYTCKNCGKEYEKRHQLIGHYSACGQKVRYTTSRLTKTKKDSRPKGVCRHCNEFIGKGLSSHVPYCVENPKRKENRRKQSERSKKVWESDTYRRKISSSVSKTIKEKVNNGEWHFSFSKSRTHEYKGVRLYGKWELNYAKWLDKHDIKWKRPTIKFPYIFEGVKRMYTPDFYLVDSNEYVEIKGYETDKDKAKWSQFPEKLKVLKGKDLHKLGIISEYKEV